MVPIGFGVGWLGWQLIIVTVVLGHGLGAVTIVVRRLTHAARTPPAAGYLPGRRVVRGRGRRSRRPLSSWGTTPNRHRATVDSGLSAAQA
jgi:hypothetical protein